MPALQLLAPRTPDEAGLSLELLTQLALKTLYYAGELTGADLARRLGVAFGVIEPSLDFLRRRRHCEVVGAAMVGGSSFRYRIADEGRSLAAQYLQQDRYVGTAPVPLSQYRAYMAEQKGAGMARVSRDQLRQALSHLVVGDRVLDELGPAVNGGHSLFIYGPSGNGKTVMAQALRKLLPGDLAIPRALEVEGRIVRVFDPLTHEELPADEHEGLELNLEVDARWARCRRPLVTVGGELTIDMLELTHDDRLGYYRAPLQLAANGGILVIDDFGRQRASPRDLLNRWLVPLESRVDYLTLESGLRFEVPFQVFVVFATNLTPSALVDDAFLRRVQYKVFADSPNSEAFARIFELCCHERGIPFDGALVAHLLEGHYRAHGIAPRGCQPRDLINQALLLAEYRVSPRRLTPELLDAACDSYFVHDRA